MCFSLHYSNLALLMDFPLMMRNLFEYYFPSTIDGNSFETEQTVSVNCRGDELKVKGYVRVPRAESDIFAEEGAITGPYYEVDESDYYRDLLLYLAGALVFLLLLEWYLQHKENSI